MPKPGMPGLGPGGEGIPGIIGLFCETPNCWFILAAAAAAACCASIDLQIKDTGVKLSQKTNDA